MKLSRQFRKPFKKIMGEMMVAFWLPASYLGCCVEIGFVIGVILSVDYVENIYSIS